MTIAAQWVVFGLIGVGMFVIGLLARHHGRDSKDAKEEHTATAGVRDEKVRKDKEPAAFAGRGF